MRALSLAIIAVPFVLSGCAPVDGMGDPAASTQVARTCFYPGQVRNFRTDRDQTLYVRAAVNQVFELSTLGGCPDLDGAVGISIIPRFSGGDRLCRGDQAQVVVGQPSPSFSAPCYVRVERALTPEEVEALPERVRP